MNWYESMAVTPKNWGNDDLTSFIQEAYEKRLTTYHKYRGKPEVRALIDINKDLQAQLTRVCR